MTAQTPISKRVAELIDRHENGNVTAAARRLGVSQRGLAKVYRGETRYPRVDLLQGLVREYGADPSWLLTGIPAAKWPIRDDDVGEVIAPELPAELLDALRAAWPNVISRLRPPTTSEE